MSRTKAQIKEHFNVQAKEYDMSKCFKSIMTCYPYIFNTLATIKYGNILDIGCGTGELLATLLRDNPSIKEYGIDIAPNMIEAAKEKLPSKVELSVGDAEELPYDNKQFDLVVMSFSFQYLINAEIALREVYRVLKKNGKLVIADEWIPSSLRKVKTLFGSSLEKLYDADEIKRILMDTGFEYVIWNKASSNSYITSCEKRQ